MGVSGAGKTVVGQALSHALGWKFFDADDFHSPQNIAKMHRGEGLNDSDRLPWLASLRALVATTVAEDDHAVIACSALKQWHRDALVPHDVPPDVIEFVFLEVPPDVVLKRLVARQHKFATPALLPSQFAALEPPRDAIRIDGALPVADIVQAVLRRWGREKTS